MITVKGYVCRPECLRASTDPSKRKGASTDMKIAVIGATGRVGGLVADELISRGHEVTGFVIDPENIRNEKINVIKKSIFDLTTDDLRGFDAVVSAFGQFDPELVYQHQTAMTCLIHAMSDLPKIRLLVVGGAASLFTDDTKEHRVIEMIPEQFRGVPSNQFEAFKMLEKSDLNWTFFSPAFTFDPKGPRTGKYDIGTDVMFKNDGGESYISYADYAIAMVDEIEKGRFKKRRFTAVSEKDPELAARKKVFPDMTDSFEGVSQYKAPFCFELAGKSVQLVMDDGTEGTVFFMTGETLQWIPKGGSGINQKYDCMKGDEETYMVNMEIIGAKPRTGLTLILDMEQSLVTAVFAHTGTNPKFPYLVTNEIVFGAIKVPGRPLPFKRHGYSSDLNNARLSWRCMATDGTLTHVYGDSLYIRVADPPAGTPLAEAFRNHPYDERSIIIKIKKNLYLYSFLESNTTYNGHIGNNLVILTDISRTHDIGRSFGSRGNGNPMIAGDLEPENYMYSGIARWEESNGDEERRPSMYRV